MHVKEGYISNYKTHESQWDESMHYAGRAFDILLVNSESLQPAGTRITIYRRLCTLSALAYHFARFSFAEVRKDHVHVSCE